MIFQKAFSDMFDKYLAYFKVYKEEFDLENYYNNVCRLNQVIDDESWLNNLMASYLAAKYDVEIIEI